MPEITLGPWLALTLISRFLTYSPPLTSIQIGILLATEGQKRTLEDLATTLSRSETIIGVNVSKLTNEGLVEKIPNLADLRKFFIQLTPRGLEFVRWTQEP